MSDTESVFEEDSTDQELIAVVRVNRFLYDKTEKLYANVEVKTNAWAQISASLTNPLEGKFILDIFKCVNGFVAICCYNIVDEQGVT